MFLLQDCIVKRKPSKLRTDNVGRSAQSWNSVIEIVLLRYQQCLRGHVPVTGLDREVGVLGDGILDFVTQEAESY